MSIVRVGMAEDNKFGDGYEAIFGKKGGAAKGAGKPAAKKPAATAKKPVATAKKPAAKKK